MEQQLINYLIIGIGSFFIAALILTSSLLTYYLSKLYKKVYEEQSENSYLRKNEGGVSNVGLDLDSELNRRYTMHTPEPESIQSLDIMRPADDRSLKRKTNNKDSSKSNNFNRGSVIDVSEEFNWRTTTNDGSKYNANITLQHRDETFAGPHESRTAFNDRSF